MLMGYLGEVATEEQTGFVRFFELARELDFQVEIPLVANGDIGKTKRAFELAYDLIETADVLVVRGMSYLQEKNMVARLHERIANDLSLIVVPGIGTGMDWGNWLLAKYDMTVTTLRLVDRNQKHLNAQFTDTEGAFRYPPLYAQVDSVLMNDPFAIYYGGESFPVLVADGDFKVIDWTKDLLTDWNARELAPICVWNSTSGTSVFVLGGNPFIDQISATVPGIAANEQLAKNFLRLICSHQSQFFTGQLASRIEVNLCDFVTDVLKKSGRDWWEDHVPERIRIKCEERRGHEGGWCPKEGYFELIDYKKMISQNWGLFESHLNEVGYEGGKNKALRWLDRLNEMRKFIGHPTKKYITNHKFSAEEKAFLSECDLRVRRLRSILRPRIFWSPESEESANE